MGGTGRKALTITGALIGMYLIAAHATGWGNLLLNAGKAGSSTIKTLQGR
jgi:hypothetical protein